MNNVLDVGLNHSFETVGAQVIPIDGKTLKG